MRQASPIAVVRLTIRVVTGTIMLAVAACDRGAKPAPAAGGWAGYNNTLDGQRFSGLDQINTGNVARLRPVCEFTLGEEGTFQTGPIVVNDTMFITTPHTTVAMNAARCAPYWRHVDTSGLQDPASVNRGIAYLDGRLFRGMPGNVSRATWGTTGTPKIIVMVLDGPERGPLLVALPEVNSQGTETNNAGSGQQAFAQYCAGCHGTRGEGLSGPSLTSAAARHDLAAIAAFIKDPKPPMPDLHPSPLDDAEVTAIAQYVRTLQGGSARRGTAFARRSATPARTAVRDGFHPDRRK